MRISPDFDEEQVRIIDSIEGIGKKRTTRIKHIVLLWLTEQGYFRRKNH